MRRPTVAARAASSGRPGDGGGHDVDVTEFDFRDNGGVCYDENGAKIIHWQRSHAKDGASAYRLEWNGLRVVWTGDGRPSKLER